jgi:hypothetical protein
MARYAVIMSIFRVSLHGPPHSVSIWSPSGLRLVSVCTKRAVEPPCVWRSSLTNCFPKGSNGDAVDPTVCNPECVALPLQPRALDVQSTVLPVDSGEKSPGHNKCIRRRGFFRLYKGPSPAVKRNSFQLPDCFKSHR